MHLVNKWLNQNTTYVYIGFGIAVLLLGYALYSHFRVRRKAGPVYYHSTDELMEYLTHNKTSEYPICDYSYGVPEKNIRIPSYREFVGTIGKEDFNTEIEDEELGTVMAYINFGDNLPTVTVPVFKTDDKGKQIQAGEKTVTLRQRMHNGQSVYWLKSMKRTIEPPSNEQEFLSRFLEPIEPKRELDEILPENLWIALHRAYDLVPIVYELPPPEWLLGMMKYAVIALAIGALIFVVARGK